MSDQPISRFPVPELDELPDDIRDRILTVEEKSPLLADQVATNYSKADITTRQKAMLDFAIKVSQQAQMIDDSDIENVRQHGFSDEDIWDIGAISAFFSLSNRMTGLTNMRPNNEFFLMGRKEKN